MDFGVYEEPSDGEDFGPEPPLPRVKLDTLDRVRREMGVLYREGKFGRRSTQDVSRLANVLALMARVLEGGEMERRMERLEKVLLERVH